jgi:hypothetical protein
VHNSKGTYVAEKLVEIDIISHGSKAMGKKGGGVKSGVGVHERWL